MCDLRVLCGNKNLCDLWDLCDNKTSVGRLLFADAGVGEAEGFELLAVVDVAAVDNNMAGHDLLDDIPRGETELAPLGHEGEDVGTICGIVHILTIGDAVANATLALVHGDGVEDAHGGAILQQAVDDYQGGSLAHIVGLGLEGESENGDGLALHATHGLDDLIVNDVLLSFVDTLDGLDDLHVVAVVQTGV